MIREIKQKIESQKPLILNITNHVTSNFMANALLALGASPVMSVDQRDALELMQHAEAININIGTLDQDSIDLSLLIAQKNLKQKALILDPVGAGASQIRTQTSLSLLPYASVLRGNIGEIAALDGNLDTMSGVDSTIHLDTQNTSQISSILSFANTHNCILGISGKIDSITNGKDIFHSSFGSKLMSQITGMGCVLSAVTAAFCAVEKDLFKATKIAFIYYSLCGEMAAQKTTSLGFFQNYFIESLANPDYNYIEETLKNNHIII